MVDIVRGSEVPVAVRKRAGYISLLARFPMEVEGVFESVTPGLPSHDSPALLPSPFDMTLSSYSFYLHRQ